MDSSPIVVLSCVRGPYAGSVMSCMHRAVAHFLVAFRPKRRSHVQLLFRFTVTSCWQMKAAAALAAFVLLVCLQAGFAQKLNVHGASPHFAAVLALIPASLVQLSATPTTTWAGSRRSISTSTAPTTRFSTPACSMFSTRWCWRCRPTRPVSAACLACVACPDVCHPLARRQVRLR